MDIIKGLIAALIALVVVIDTSKTDNGYVPQGSSSRVK